MMRRIEVESENKISAELRIPALGNNLKSYTFLINFTDT